VTIGDLAHSWAANAVLEALGTDPALGLSHGEAQRRLQQSGPNTIESTPPVPTWILVRRQFRNPLVLLLVAAIAVSLIAWMVEGTVGLPIDAIVIAVIVVANALLGALQEHRADEAVRALSQIAEGRANVRREGILSSVPFSELVVGDLVELAEGDLVPADARVVTSASLFVAEAALTGESVPVSKHAGPVATDTAMADRTSMMFAGTAVVAGHGACVVTATSLDTEVGHIAAMLIDTEQPPTPLEREIGAVSRFLGVAVVVVAVIVSVVISVTSTIDSPSDVVDVLLLGVSLAVAAVPEGLPAVLSMVLAVGVSRMAQRHALVKRPAAAETLGSATVICTDKTGTLTRNEMESQTVVIASSRVDLPVSEPTSESDQRAVDTLVAAAAASNAELATTGSAVGATGDPTEISLLVAAHAAGQKERLESIDRLEEIPFDTDRKRMSVLVTGFPAAGNRAMLTKGAPDIMLDLCSRKMTAAGPVRLSPADRTWWREQIDTLADQAMRTLLIATRDLKSCSAFTVAEEQDLVLLGVVGMLDPPRAGVAEAIATAQHAGVRVIMLTGDHPKTGARIASDLGIQVGEAPVVLGQEIDHLDDEALAEVVAAHSVFARVAPAHKLRMVRSLQDQQHVVAMTGDGVNDAPALRAADIGAAMGMTGTAVAREAADIVLTNDDFSTIVEAIRGGRTIFQNVANFLRYLLSSNVGEVLTIFLGVLFAGLIGLEAEDGVILAPLTAAQILWINLLTDTGPAFALGLDGAERVMGRPPRLPGTRVIDAAMRRGIVIVGLAMAFATLLAFDAELPGGLIEGNGDTATARTMAFTVLVLAQLFNCFSARSDHRTAMRGWASNPYLLVAVAGSFALQLAVVYVPPLQRGFATTGLSFRDWLAATAWASSVLLVSEVRKWVERRAHVRR